MMESINNLSNNGRLVVSVIHQPRSAIFNMCDKLLLLSGGQTIYFGQTGLDSVMYFSKLGFCCPDEYNPGDYLIDLISKDTRTPEAEKESVDRILLLQNAYIEHQQLVDKSNVHQSDGNVIDSIAKATNDISTFKTIDSDIDFNRIFNNLKLLSWRSWTEQSRDIPTISIKLISNIFFSLLIGGIYSNIGYDQKSIHNRTGLLFFVAINSAFNSVFSVLNTFPKEKNIVNRERSMGAYDTLSYFTSKVFVEMPLNVVPSLIYSCILYYIVGLNSKTFGFFILILMLETVVSISLGMMVSAFAPSVEAANAIGPPFLIIGILFGGFYISVRSLPIVANWIPYISFIRWSFESLCINEFQGLRFNCDGVDPQACITTGEQQLNRLDYGGHTVSYPVFGLGMLLLAYLLLAFSILHFSYLKFTPLGFTGRNYHKVIECDGVSAANGGIGGSAYTHVNKKDDVEVMVSTS